MLLAGHFTTILYANSTAALSKGQQIDFYDILYFDAVSRVDRINIYEISRKVSYEIILCEHFALTFCDKQHDCISRFVRTTICDFLYEIWLNNNTPKTGNTDM